jgi:gluconolactonase
LDKKGRDMKIALLRMLVLLGCWATSCAAGEVTVVRDVLGPEGPLYVDGALYYVGWVSDTLSRWDGKTSVVLNHTPGCGHNGLALTRQKTFLVACIHQGAILELDLMGKLIRRWDADKAGRPFEGGVNDVVVAANGGAYASLYGPEGDPPTLIIGKVLYLAPGSGQWVQVADGLNYANGLGISPDQKTLYVGESVGNLVNQYVIEPGGSLSHRANFALLNVPVSNKVESWSIGPDSMKVDHQGNLYVAQYSGGRILKISPAGKLLHVFEIAAGDGTTNVAFGEAERDLYVTVVKDLNDPQSKGSVVKIRNWP